MQRLIQSRLLAVNPAAEKNNFVSLKERNETAFRCPAQSRYTGRLRLRAAGMDGSRAQIKPASNRKQFRFEDNSERKIT
jgi:hypothetical protein